jgi:hypothetical protein
LGREPSPAVDESGHSRSQRFNVGNLRDTGHSAEATPPTAMAEEETTAQQSLYFRSQYFPDESALSD